MKLAFGWSPPRDDEHVPTGLRFTAAEMSVTMRAVTLLSVEAIVTTSDCDQQRLPSARDTRRSSQTV